MNVTNTSQAIKVTLNTFISSQKFAIAQQLQKTFAKYITIKDDNNELLMFMLRSIVREYINAEPDKAIEIELEEFEGRARENSITNILPFFQSKLFKESHFSYDRRNRRITYEG